MLVNVKIVTHEVPTEQEPWTKIITEELINLRPDEAYAYIRDNVLDVPDKKWTSLDEYWNECWAKYERTDDNEKFIESIMNFYNRRYEFWIEEKTGESLKAWLDNAKSPEFTISFDNIQIDVINLSATVD